MPSAPPLLEVTQDPHDTLKFFLKGSSSGLEAMPLLQGIRVRLSDISGVKNVIFDLCDVNPVFNTAGRVFDIAKHFAPHLAKQGAVTTIRIPWDIYEELQRTDDLPQPAQTIQFEDITIELTKSTTFPSTSDALVPALISGRSSELLSYTGEILEIDKNTVTVRLKTNTSEDEEIIGELDRRQFPMNTLTVGGTFRYTTTVKEPGRTEVKVALIDELSIHPDDLLDIWEEVSARIPDDEGKADVS